MITIRSTELVKLPEKNLLLSIKNFPDPVYEKILEKGKPLRYFINKIASGVGLKHKETGDIPYIVGEDMDDFGFIQPTKYVDDSPLILKPGTLLTGRVGSVGKVAILDIDATASDNILYIILKEKEMLIYLKWFFLSRFGKYQLNKITKGKSQPVINKTNLLRFRVVIPPQLSDITKRLLDIEEKIRNLRKNIRETPDIVDEVFSKYFKLDLRQYSNLEKKHVFGENLLDLSKTAQLRSSLKFHHPKYDFILEKVKEFRTAKLKQLLKEPIRRGVQLEYDEN
ncbi:MAG: restriction endonuclease subunit S [Candidatus Desulfofervidaceae bacterium]|nr:restriction endonuclease subunit S [Candidatus Desulfofervidaceae bacterium]